LQSTEPIVGLSAAQARVSIEAQRLNMSSIKNTDITAGIVPVLDHVVINVLNTLDEAAAQYEALGFALTERGHHTLGTSNNLAIFSTNYLELLGYMPGRETSRPDLWQHPAGLTGLVFKSIDPKIVYETMSARGAPVEEPASFARPVQLADGPHDARFTVTRIGAEAVQNGRTFFCHHHTPELVWRPEWQIHPNGVTDVVEFVIASSDPKRTAALYDRMFGPGLLMTCDGGVSFSAGAATVFVLTPAEIAKRYGDSAVASADGSDRMVGLTFKTQSVDKVRALLNSKSVPFKPFAGGGIVVPYQYAANVAVAFVG
jgi:hypothetical protein